MKWAFIFGALAASGHMAGSPSPFYGLLPICGVLIAYVCGVALGRSL